MLGAQREHWDRPRDSSYLLYVSNFREFDDFVPLGGSRPGARALETQVTTKTGESDLKLKLLSNFRFFCYICRKSLNIPMINALAHPINYFRSNN